MFGVCVGGCAAGSGCIFAGRVAGLIAFVVVFSVGFASLLLLSVRGRILAFFGFVFLLVMFSFVSLSMTSWWLASGFISIVVDNGSRCAMLHCRLRVAPSIKTRLFAGSVRTTQCCPASLPAIFMHSLPGVIIVFSLC